MLQKYYTEDFLTHKTVKNDGKYPQYYVEDDHAPVVPKAVFFQVQGEVMRRGSDPTRLHLGSSSALAGRLICGRCGRVLKRYTRPNPDLTDWRCRDRASTLSSNTGSRAGTCGCRFALEREVKEGIVTALNTVPALREQILLEMTSLREGELRRIDALINASEEAEKRMEEQLTALEEAGGDTALLEAQIAEEHARRDGLLLERAEHANKEVHLRLLMELISLLTTDNPAQPTPVNDCAGESGMNGRAVDARAADGRNEVTGGGRQVVVRRVDHEPGACYEVEDFFRLTRPVYPEGVVSDGRVVRFDNEMAIRYVDRVIVKDDSYEVRLKGGVTITV